MNRRNNLFLSVFAIALVPAGAFGCQAILGIDETSFQQTENGADAAPGDASSDGAPAGDASSTDSGDAGASALLAFSPARVFVRQGGEADVTVTLNRGAFSGAATIALASIGDAGVTANGGDTDDGGPDASEPATPNGADGVSVPTLVIPAGSNTGTLHVFAAAAAIVGTSALDFSVTTNVATAVSLPILVAGAPGTVDTSFNQTGIVSDVAGGVGNSIAIAEDDTIYVGGSHSGWMLRRYFPDGTADATFNTTIATALGANGGSISRVAVRGTTLVFGGSDGNSDLEIKKFSTAGVLDGAFGQSGVFNLVIGGGGLYPGNTTGLAITATGDVLATGTNTRLNESFAFLFHGLGDPTTYDYGASFVPCDIRIDTNGDPVVGGIFIGADAGQNYFGQRLTSTFTDAGANTSGSLADDVVAMHMAVSPNGQFIIAGNQDFDEPGGALGSFDETTLASDLDINVHNVGTADEGFGGITAQTDAKFLVTGNGGGQMLNTYVRRYEADGGTDESFGAVNGEFLIEQTGFGPVTSFHDVAIDSWGRVIAIGENTSLGFYMTRLWP